MATFVLVHGAWHGGWCWADTAEALRDAGHDVHTPTLTGLGERSHLMSPDITPDLHVEDIVQALNFRSLHDVVLVGHSYGGVVVSGVAGRVPERIRSLVYLDAYVAEESLVSKFPTGNPERMAAFEAQVADGSYTVAPDNFDAWTDQVDRAAWLRAMCTPHPIRCFREGVTLTGRQNTIRDRHYILAVRNKPSPFWVEYARLEGKAGWRLHKIDTKHDAMVDAPHGLAHLLTEIGVD